MHCILLAWNAMQSVSSECKRAISVCMVWCSGLRDVQLYFTIAEISRWPSY